LALITDWKSPFRETIADDGARWSATATAATPVQATRPRRGGLAHDKRPSRPRRQLRHRCVRDTLWICPSARRVAQSPPPFDRIIIDRTLSLAHSVPPSLTPPLALSHSPSLSFSLPFPLSFSLRRPPRTVVARIRSPDTVRTRPEVTIRYNNGAHGGTSLSYPRIVTTVLVVRFFYFSGSRSSLIVALYSRCFPRDVYCRRRYACSAFDDRVTVTSASTTEPPPPNVSRTASAERQRVSSRRLSSNIIIQRRPASCFNYPIRHHYYVIGFIELVDAITRRSDVVTCHDIWHILYIYMTRYVMSVLYNKKKVHFTLSFSCFQRITLVGGIGVTTDTYIDL